MRWTDGNVSSINIELKSRRDSIRPFRSISRPGLSKIPVNK